MNDIVQDRYDRSNGLLYLLIQFDKVSKIGSPTENYFSDFSSKLDFPVFTFGGTVSPCHSENSMDTRSPLMYEIEDQSFFKDKLSQSIAVGETSPTLEELDPSLELAVDLQGLINSNIGQNNSHDNIFRDLLVTDHSQPAFVDISVNLQNSYSPSVDSQDESSNQSVQMPHLVQGYEQTTYQEVKQEPSLQEVSTLDLTSLLGGTHFPFEGNYQFVVRSEVKYMLNMRVNYCHQNISV